MFYEKGRRLGELNEKNQEKSPLVGNTHQWILHIVFNFSDKLYTIKEKVLKQSLTSLILYRIHVK